MKVNIEELRRFDFTPECKSCPYCKELGLLEYCCGFVIDEIRKKRFQQMKDKVYEYMDFSEDLTVLDPSNVLFQRDDTWSVKLNFKTNLKPNKDLVLKHLTNLISDSMYFKEVDFNRDSLKHTDESVKDVVFQTKIDSFIKDKESVPE